MLTFGLMGLILKLLVNYWSVYQTDIRGFRMLLFLLLVATYFIYKHPLYIIVIAILLAEPFIKE